MKKILRHILLLSGLFLCNGLSAQIPYFSSWPKGGTVPVYISATIDSDKNAKNPWDIYTFFQCGITDNFSIGANMEFHNTAITFGPEVRGGYEFNDYFSFSLHVIPRFDIATNLSFENVMTGLYMQGQIAPEYTLFWLSNTYNYVYRGWATDWWQYWYLGSYIPLGGEHQLVPLAGCSHSWRFDSHPEFNLGLMYIYKDWSFMLFCTEIISCRPIISLGVEVDINVARHNDN